MELARVLRELLQRRWLLALGVLIAAVAAVLSVYRIEGAKLKSRSLQRSGASTQLLVDSQSSVLGNVSQSLEALSTRATVYANFMPSPVVLELIAQKVGLSGSQIYAAGPVNPAQPRVVQEPTALKRNVQITGETNPYRLEFEAPSGQPTINVYAQAPTTQMAVNLANASVSAIQQFVSSLESANKIAPASRVVIRQLGPAHGSVVDAGISKALAALVFVGVFLLWCVLMLVGARFRVAWRESAVDTGADAEQHEDVAAPPEWHGREVAQQPLRPRETLEPAMFEAPARERLDEGEPVHPIQSVR